MLALSPKYMQKLMTSLMFTGTTHSKPPSPPAYRVVPVTTCLPASALDVLSKAVGVTPLQYKSSMPFLGSKSCFPFYSE